MTTSQKLSKIGELLDDIIDDVDNPEPMSPPEAVALFLDYLQGFDAEELEQTLKALSNWFNTWSKDSHHDFVRPAVHIELAYEAWKNRSGN